MEDLHRSSSYPRHNEMLQCIEWLTKESFVKWKGRNDERSTSSSCILSVSTSCSASPVIYYSLRTNILSIRSISILSLCFCCEMNDEYDFVRVWYNMAVLHKKVKLLQPTLHPWYYWCRDVGAYESIQEFLNIVDKNKVTRCMHHLPSMQISRLISRDGIPNHTWETTFCNHQFLEEYWHRARGQCTTGHSLHEIWPF